MRAQKNSSRVCGVLNSDKSQFKSRLLHARKPPIPKHTFIEMVSITKVHIGGLKVIQNVHR